ncbi:MAG: hypothetical protein P8I78_03870, partial [Flavobacterium sp.]|nr:hypothetical protein [Flavobacterium sp.]
MESKKLFLGVAAIALGLTSCKGEKETQAEKTVDNYVVYVDSLENVSSEEAMANWQTIEANYELRSSQAETALAD